MAAARVMPQQPPPPPPSVPLTTAAVRAHHNIVRTRITLGIIAVSGILLLGIIVGVFLYANARIDSQITELDARIDTMARLIARVETFALELAADTVSTTNAGGSTPFYLPRTLPNGEVAVDATMRVTGGVVSDATVVTRAAPNTVPLGVPAFTPYTSTPVPGAFNASDVCAVNVSVSQGALACPGIDDAALCALVGCCWRGETASPGAPCLFPTFVPTPAAQFEPRTPLDPGYDEPQRIFPALYSSGTLFMTPGSYVVVNQGGDVLVCVENNATTGACARYESLRIVMLAVAQLQATQLDTQLNPDYLALIAHLAVVAPYLYAYDNTTLGIALALHVNTSLTTGGNVHIGGNIEVDGNIVVHGGIEIAGDFTVDGTMTARHVQATQSIGSNGTLAVEGPVTFDSTLEVGGNVIVHGGIEIAGDFTVDGTMTAQHVQATQSISSNGTLQVDGAVLLTNYTRIEDTLEVDGETHLHSSLEVEFDATFARNVSIGDSIFVGTSAGGGGACAVVAAGGTLSGAPLEFKGALLPANAMNITVAMATTPSSGGTSVIMRSGITCSATTHLCTFSVPEQIFAYGLAAAIWMPTFIYRQRADFSGGASAAPAADCIDVIVGAIGVDVRWLEPRACNRRIDTTAAAAVATCHVAAQCDPLTETARGAGFSTNDTALDATIALLCCADVWLECGSDAQDAPPLPTDCGVHGSMAYDGTCRCDTCWVGAACDAPAQCGACSTCDPSYGCLATCGNATFITCNATSGQCTTCNHGTIIGDQCVCWGTSQSCGANGVCTVCNTTNNEWCGNEGTTCICLAGYERNATTGACDIVPCPPCMTHAVASDGTATGECVWACNTGYESGAICSLYNQPPLLGAYAPYEAIYAPPPINNTDTNSTVLRIPLSDSSRFTFMQLVTDLPSDDTDSVVDITVTALLDDVEVVVFTYNFSDAAHTPQGAQGWFLIDSLLVLLRASVETTIYPTRSLFFLPFPLVPCPPCTAPLFVYLVGGAWGLRAIVPNTTDPEVLLNETYVPFNEFASAMINPSALDPPYMCAPCSDDSVNAPITFFIPSANYTAPGPNIGPTFFYDAGGIMLMQFSGLAPDGDLLVMYESNHSPAPVIRRFIAFNGCLNSCYAVLDTGVSYLPGWPIFNSEIPIPVPADTWTYWVLGDFDLENAVFVTGQYGEFPDGQNIQAWQANASTIFNAFYFSGFGSFDTKFFNATMYWMNNASYIPPVSATLGELPLMMSSLSASVTDTLAWPTCSGCMRLNLCGPLNASVSPGCRVCNATLGETCSRVIDPSVPPVDWTCICNEGACWRNDTDGTGVCVQTANATRCEQCLNVGWPAQGRCLCDGPQQICDTSTVGCVTCATRAFQPPLGQLCSTECVCDAQDAWCQACDFANVTRPFYQLCTATQGCAAGVCAACNATEVRYIDANNVPRCIQCPPGSTPLTDGSSLCQCTHTPERVNPVTHEVCDPRRPLDPAFYIYPGTPGGDNMCHCDPAVGCQAHCAVQLDADMGVRGAGFPGVCSLDNGITCTGTVVYRVTLESVNALNGACPTALTQPLASPPLFIPYIVPASVQVPTRFTEGCDYPNMPNDFSYQRCNTLAFAFCSHNIGAPFCTCAADYVDECTGDTGLWNSGVQQCEITTFPESFVTAYAPFGIATATPGPTTLQFTPYDFWSCSAGEVLGDAQLPCMAGNVDASTRAGIVQYQACVDPLAAGTADINWNADKIITQFNHTQYQPFTTSRTAWMANHAGCDGDIVGGHVLINVSHIAVTQSPPLSAASPVALFDYFNTSTQLCACLQCGVRIAADMSVPDEPSCNFLGVQPLACGDTHAWSYCAPGETLRSVVTAQRNPTSAQPANTALVVMCCDTRLVLP